MLTAGSFFRGNYMTPIAAQALLDEICAEPELIPEHWNIYEPIDIPFKRGNNKDVVRALVSSDQVIRSLVFFVRDANPRYLLTIDLVLAPVQGLTPHNKISIEVETPWPGGEQKLADYVSRSVLPNFPDYARVTNSAPEDQDRLREFHRSYTPKEFLELLSKQKEIIPPFGPYGCLEDVFWFNYYGRVYVEFIGKERLVSAGWTRVEEIGDGVACYATEDIEDRRSREQRTRILGALEEFFWTPGCKREDKRVPVFDFSDQLAAIPPELRNTLAQATSHRIIFAGFTDREAKQAMGQLKEDDEVQGL